MKASEHGLSLARLGVTRAFSQQLEVEQVLRAAGGPLVGDELGASEEREFESPDGAKHPPSPRLVELDATRDRLPMCVRVSHDEGERWPFGCVLDADAGGYSSLAKTGDHRIAALTEVTQADGHRAIRLSRFNQAWIYTGCERRCP